MTERQIVLVSACLIGLNTRYDGASKRDSRVLEFLKDKIAIPVCPELLAGLGIPRPPAELESGDGFALLAGNARVVLKDGREVSKEFLNGARQALKIAQYSRPALAVLKENSPACGVNSIYLRGKLARGTGVFAALLLKQGYRVLSEKELPG